MIGAEFYFRDKIPVAILGATGCVGQKFIQLLENHPWFEIVALCASERSVGKRYGDAVKWLMTTSLPIKIAQMVITPCLPPIPAKILFSALDSSVAGEIETNMALAGYPVISNSRNHRMDPQVPLLIAEINPDHLNLVKNQSFGSGMIITNSNCSVMGLALALKPLMDLFGIEAVNVVTLQAISGAGYPGTASLDVIDNVVPFISGEEEKIESEPLKILGSLKEQIIQPADFLISAQCNRVPVTDGHLECISIKLKSQTKPEEIIRAWKNFSGEPQWIKLPFAPEQPIYYLEEESYPQPKLHRDLEKGMAIAIGRLRKCPILDYKFVLLSHNTVRGAAGAAILNAELLVKKGWVFW